MPSKHPSRAPESDSSPLDKDADYIRRSHLQTQRYTQEWHTWWASLSPDEQKKFAAAGITEPLQDSSRVSGHAPNEDRDPRESTLANVGFNFRSLDESAQEATAAAASPWLDPFVSLTMQRVIGTLISSENAKVSVIALAFALNLDALNGLGSIREAARRLGLSPEAISKKKREWEEDLEIPPNAFAKSVTAKIALSLAQQTKHWKKARWTSPKKA